MGRMSITAAGVVVLLLVIIMRSSGYCSAAYEADLIDELPGQPGGAAPFKQYGGYVTVDASAGRAFYYYFVEAQASPSTSPLTLWLNGGPGCSSVGAGAFTELGPFFPTPKGDLKINDYAWNKYSNVLFVESPTGVGFSYSNTSFDYLKTHANDVDTAKDNLMFLLGWLEKFPEYKGRPLYITGESYAGHYVPQLAKNVLLYIKENGSSVLSLKGIAIGNPLLDDFDDFVSAYEYYWTHGLISYGTITSITKYCNFSANTISKQCEDALLDVPNEIGNGINFYDILVDVCLDATTFRLMKQRMRNQKVASLYILGKDSDDFNNIGQDVCISNEVSAYLNRPDVQAKMHANITKLPYAWSLCSSVIVYGFENSPLTMVPVLKEIVNEGVRVLVYSGDQDAVLPHVGTQKIISKLARSLKLNVTTPYQNWFQGSQVGGWAITYGTGKLSFTTVRGAGHYVPGSQGPRALTMFKSFLKGIPLSSSSKH